MTLLVAISFFMGGYLLNIFYITVLYHRGLTHRALELRPRGFKLIAATGNWLTGIDPKAWACMHRLHHLHSDTTKDPHSPIHQGVFGVLLGQLRSYERVLGKLISGDPQLTRLVADIPFEVSALNRRRLWGLPYLLHFSIAIGLGWAFQSWMVGTGYFLGIMSHPIQGWMVNSLAHRFGYRNFESTDNSRNNRLVAWLVFGEGFQNNHHELPQNARFSVKSGEVDLGYALCRLAGVMGLVVPPAVADTRWIDASIQRH